MTQGCYPGCFYYSDSCFRKDCKLKQPIKPTVSPTPMPIYPTLGSLQEVVDLADAKHPINSKNELYSLLMTYHNTLLAILHGTTSKDSHTRHR